MGFDHYAFESSYVEKAHSLRWRRR